MAPTSICTGMREMDPDNHMVVFMAWFFFNSIFFFSQMSADKGVRCFYKRLGDGCTGVAMHVAVLCITLTQKVPALVGS